MGGILYIYIKKMTKRKKTFPNMETHKEEEREATGERENVGSSEFRTGIPFFADVGE